MENFYSIIFDRKGMNSKDLAIKYSLSQKDEKYINQYLYPIFEVNNLSDKEIQIDLKKRKERFLKTNNIDFDFNLFIKYENLEFWFFEIENYYKKFVSNNVSFKIQKNAYIFYEIFEVGSTERTALISNKTEIELQIYLKKILDLINELKIKNSLPPQQTKKHKPELIINQIALLYVYTGKQITRENANNIVKEYGHNSGEKLFQRFTYYSSTANRKGKPINCTPKKLDNKIKLLESVIELLDTSNQKRVKDEVLMLKTRYESEYQ